MKRINITGRLMYVIWLVLFFKKLQAPCFSFFIFFWRRASPPGTTCRQAPWRLHVDTTTIASVYSTKRKLHEVWHAGRINDNHMAPAIMPYHDMQVMKI